MKKKIAVAVMVVAGMFTSFNLPGSPVPVSALVGAGVKKALGDATKKSTAVAVRGATGSAVSSAVGEMSSALAKARAKTVLAATVGGGVGAGALVAAHNVSAGEREKLDAQADAIRKVGDATAENVAKNPSLASVALPFIAESDRTGFIGRLTEAVQYVMWILFILLAVVGGLYAKGALIRAWRYSKENDNG